MLQQLKNIDYHSLPISDYSRNYILRMLPNIDYYLEIYQRSIDLMLQRIGKKAEDTIMVDYGGGHGFLSLTAKKMGIGKVIYIDLNPQAVEAVRAVAAQVGLSPDIILQGDSKELGQWCMENGVVPDAVLGMDVIEHIYKLEHFFHHLYATNPNLFMLFTTGSTPFNPWVKKRLRRIMMQDELGHGGKPGYFQLRKQFILRNYPDLSDVDADVWATNTRGLTYPDILIAVDTHLPNIRVDNYNTCDPATGNWTERILSIKRYQRIADRYHATVEVELGYYNRHRKGLKGLVARIVNLFIRKTDCRKLAPFITLLFIKK